MTQPRLAIIIATYGRESVLCETVACVLKADYDRALTEVIIVDQTVTHEPATIEYLSERETSGDLRWFRPPAIDFASLTKARNFGIAQVPGAEFIIFIDDDVEFSPDFFANHLAAYVEPNVLATAGRVITLGTPDVVRNEGVGSISWMGAFAANYSGDRQCRSIDFMGCNFSLRASAIGRTGLFEEGLASRSAIREDSDMAVRVTEIGGEIRFMPKAQVLHKVHPSGGTRSEKDRIIWYYGLFHDNFMFYAKHAPAWRTPFFILHMWRPILACSFFYGKGRPSALAQPWRGIRDGIRAGRASVRAGKYSPSERPGYPAF